VKGAIRPRSFFFTVCGKLVCHTGVLLVLNRLNEMHYPLLPFGYEPTTTELEDYWRIDDLLQPQDALSLSSCCLYKKTCLLENPDRGFSLRIRQINPYGNGLPMFYKGYLQFDDHCLHRARCALLEPSTYVSPYALDFPQEVFCIALDCLSWGEAYGIDMSRPLSEQMGEIRGPRQVVEEALTLFSQLSIFEENLPS